MRSEITAIDLTGAGYMVATASEAPGAVDAANGMTLPIDNRGPAGLVVVIKNNGAGPKDVTMLSTERYLGAVYYLGPKPSLVLSISPGAARIITNIKSYYASYGRVDFDFEAGFTGEIVAFRLPA
jgi:hypothetical protein